MVVLTNSGRSLLKATHAPLERKDVPTRRTVEKSAFVAALALQPGELDALRKGDVFAKSRRSLKEAVVRLADFEPDRPRAPAAARAGLGDIAFEDLKRIGEAVVARRAQTLAASVGREATDLASSLVARGRTALAQFSRAFEISPVGLLHLERIEMVPAGIERGELVATVPLAPSEVTSVSQKEWSVTSEEFSQIVTDYLEQYSEKGVTEKSELATATESQNKHSQQLGLDSSVSGSYGFVTFSAKTSLDLATSNEESKKNSRSHAQEVTSKASARVRKERKVTIQTTSVIGSENVTTRVLTNPSATETMRVDYYSMMRKWRVRLFQYGLRMTYDIAIPEPGATLRQQLLQLADLERRLSETFRFPLKVRDVTIDNYQDHAEPYGAIVAAPPAPELRTTVGGVLQGLSKDDFQAWRFFEFPFVVPDGYRVSRVEVNGMMNNWDHEDSDKRRDFQIFEIADVRLPEIQDQWTNIPGVVASAWVRRVLDVEPYRSALIGTTGAQRVAFFLRCVWAGAVYFPMTFERTEDAVATWRTAAYETIRNAASDAYFAEQQSLVQQRDALLEQISGVDTLTLRREERDEVMKGVLRWLLGPGFDFMPGALDDRLAGSNASFTGDRLAWPSGVELDGGGWAGMFVYQEMVKFIHQAIEWENLLYFPYPYFWDSAGAWEFARTARHPDLTRQQFVRAGSARVVLTIRPGYEEAFTAFMEDREFGSVLPPDHPYFSIGSEMRAFAQSNYPGVPPANPEADYRPLVTPLQRKSWDDMRAIMLALEAFKDQHGAYPTTAQGLAALGGSLPAADPWGEPYRYASPGRFNDYELSSLGRAPDAEEPTPDDAETAPITSWASCNLIAEWHEYTPSRGIDIQLNTAPADAG